jgi:hypothetical protein
LRFYSTLVNEWDSNYLQFYYGSLVLTLSPSVASLFEAVVAGANMKAEEAGGSVDSLKKVYEILQLNSI